MNILIIGSKGFIGSHCVQYFSQSAEVWECDVVTDYVNQRYFLIDATNANFEEVFQSQPFDVCINCSGAANVSDSIKNPQRDFMLNVTNVFKQLDAIRKYQPQCKYLNLSSAAVYGNPVQLPIDETHPLQPISPYGNHKKMAEEVCEDFYTHYQIPTCSLRIFSAYGPGLKKQLFWDLYQKSLANNNVTLYGTGKESRDFIYISDLVRAIDCVITKATFQNNIINVANGEEIRIERIAASFFKDTQTSFVFGGESRQGDPINWVADISLLKALGYEGQVPLEEGIKHYWKWLNENE
ncbi:MAG: NAD-dependent epimerase/dehydratase family protein [Flavobacteriaceae bacterium]